MGTVEKYWDDLENYGFTREYLPNRMKFTLDPELGVGGFEIWGNPETCMACYSDVIFNRPCILYEGSEEKMMAFGHFYSGEVSFYYKENDSYLFDCGLNYYIYSLPLQGYKRIEAGKRLVNVGICYRKKFFDELQYELPVDFWETAANVLNDGVVSIPPVSFICDQIKKYDSSRDSLPMFVEAKALEALSITIEYIYINKFEPSIKLSSADRAAIENIKDILTQDLRNPPSIRDISLKIGMNQQKMMKGFKYLYNITIFGYLKRLRMEKAFYLLSTTDYSVSEIAFDVGYHGDGHFQQAFKSIYNATPQKIRNEIKFSGKKNCLVVDNTQL